MRLPIIHWYFWKYLRDCVCWNHNRSYFYINDGILNYIFDISRLGPPILSKEMVFDNKWQNFQRRSIDPSHLSSQVTFSPVDSWLGKMENSLGALWVRLSLLMPSRVVELGTLAVWVKWKERNNTIRILVSSNISQYSFPLFKCL